jgi:uncharacterized Zn finger protein
VSPEFAQVLDRSLLRRLAGSRSYERGEEYFRGGCVEGLVIEGDALTASVLGTRRYRVELRLERDLEHACTCPIGGDGAFCKHCVAVGLAFLERGTGALEHRPEPMPLDAVRAHLESLDRDALVSVLLDEANADDRLLERLRLRAATGPDRVDLASFRRAIDLAMDPHDFVAYAEAFGWSQGVDQVIDSVERLLDEGHPGAVIELSEHALTALEEAGGTVDDSDGHLSVLSARLEELHLAACERGRPDPEALAERLLRRQLDGEFDVFAHAASTYADVLGGRGLARYKELARAEWDLVPELGPGEERDYERRFRITQVMEDLARASGDVDSLTDVLRRDLSLPYSFLRIAGAYRDAGRQDEALDWAERGIEAFPERPDHRLHAFLARAYAHQERYADALEIAWDHFVDRPGLDTYRELKPYAERVGDWPGRRERALGLLRKRAAEMRGEAQRGGYAWSRNYDRSQLVRILLVEGDGEAAWGEAEAGGCDEALWLELAERRKEMHPEDALRVYRERIEPTIERKTKRDYEEAVALIERVGELLRCVGRGEEFPALVAEIRATHARKRNLISLLDGLRLEAAAPQRG